MRKRGTLLAFVISMVLLVGIGTGNALTTSIFERGCVIPYATYNASGVDTVVGITIATPISGHGIYWSFYNADGVPLMSNSITITTQHLEYSFSLSGGAAGAHSGVVGWLLFTWDDDGVLNPGEAGGLNLNANAFLVNLTTKDAAFLPVVPLSIDDYDLAAPITLLNPPNSPLISMTYGQQHAEIGMVSRFLVSSSGNPRTTLIVFTPLDAPIQFSAYASSITGAFQDGITINTTNHKLNVFDVESIAPPGFTEGDIIIYNPHTSPIGIQFSLTYWSIVGAEQTIVAGQR